MMNRKASHPIRFITLEGGEGAGKSTLIKQLVKYLTARGVEVVTTREPGGTELGEQIRSWVLASKPSVSILPKAELLLFLAARAQHIEAVIAPAIKQGKVVICDRFNDSTVAYQGAGRELGVEPVRKLCNQVCGDVVPDLTFFLDVDPEVGLQRTRRTVKDTAQAGEVDRIEQEKQAFHLRVRNAFSKFSEEEPGRFCYIDSNRPLDEVIGKALEILGSKI